MEALKDKHPYNVFPAATPHIRDGDFECWNGRQGEVSDLIRMKKTQASRGFGLGTAG